MSVKIFSKVRDLLNLPYRVGGLKPVERLDGKNPKVLNGRMLANLNNHLFPDVKKLADVEFQVYSQFGDDGIIQWLIHRIDIPEKTFVEFGVQDYTESNTRFLLVNNNWRGYVMDGSPENVGYIKNDVIGNLHHLDAKAVFITRENINQLMSELPFGKEVGIFSIDIDGNDWYVWNEVNTINPVIVIAEYNAVFGLNPWTIPYRPDFVRVTGTPQTSYWGVSLVSLYDLAKSKGYSFIGCNSAGNNAYFIRNDKLGGLKAISPEEGFEYAKFREAKGPDGEWLSEEKRLTYLAGMDVVNTRTGKTEKIGG